MQDLNGWVSGVRSKLGMGGLLYISFAYSSSLIMLHPWDNFLRGDISMNTAKYDAF